LDDRRCCRGCGRRGFHRASRRRGAGPWADYGPDCLSSLSQVGIQEGRELRLRHGADLLRFDRAVFEEDEGGNPANAEFGRRLGVLVDVELRNLDLVAVFGRDFIQDGGDHLAGTAPLCPEIEKDGFVGLQDVLGERGIRGMHDVRATHAVKPPVEWSETRDRPLETARSEGCGTKSSCLRSPSNGYTTRCLALGSCRIWNRSAGVNACGMATL